MQPEQPTPTPSAPPNLSPEGRQTLIGVMRERAEKIDAEIAQLQAEREHIASWLAENDRGGAA